MRAFHFANLLLAVVVLSGCSTATSLLPIPGTGWTTHLGQLSYQSKTRSLIGDVVLQAGPSGEIKLDFLKGPGPALLSIRQNQERAQVQGSAVGIGWQGRPADASTQLTGWLLIQPVIFALENGKALPKGVQGDLSKTPDGKWKQLKISIPSRRESFHFVFQS